MEEQIQKWFEHVPKELFSDKQCFCAGACWMYRVSSKKESILAQPYVVVGSGSGLHVFQRNPRQAEIKLLLGRIIPKTRIGFPQYLFCLKRRVINYHRAGLRNDVGSAENIKMALSSRDAFLDKIFFPMRQSRFMMGQGYFIGRSAELTPCLFIGGGKINAHNDRGQILLINGSDVSGYDMFGGSAHRSNKASRVAKVLKVHGWDVDGNVPRTRREGGNA